MAKDNLALYCNIIGGIQQKIAEHKTKADTMPQALDKLVEVSYINGLHEALQIVLDEAQNEKQNKPTQS